MKDSKDVKGEASGSVKTAADADKTAPPPKTQAEADRVVENRTLAGTKTESGEYRNADLTAGMPDKGAEKPLSQAELDEQAKADPFKPADGTVTIPLSGELKLGNGLNQVLRVSREDRDPTSNEWRQLGHSNVGAGEVVSLQLPEGASGRIVIDCVD